MPSFPSLHVWQGKQATALRQIHKAGEKPFVDSVARPFHLIAYNCIRRLMLEAADSKGEK